MGGAFLDALAVALDQACEAPDGGAPACELRGETVRTIRLRRFPFRLVYVEGTARFECWPSLTAVVARDTGVVEGDDTRCP